MNEDEEQADSFEVGDAELKGLGLDEFCFEHLPSHLAEVSRKYAERAYELTADKQGGPKVVEQRRFALHYLLLSKDAAVRMRVMMEREALRPTLR